MENVMQNQGVAKEEEFVLKQDPQAYVYAAAAFALIAAFVSAMFWAW